MKKKLRRMKKDRMARFLKREREWKEYRAKIDQQIEKSKRLIREMEEIYDFEKIHKLSMKNGDAVLKSKLVGCFYCASIFPPSDFQETDFSEWKTVDGATFTDAWCPHCGIDSVIPESKDYEITKKMLIAMGDKYFGYSERKADW